MLSPAKSRPCRSYPCHIHVRATPEEQALIYELAAQSGLSASRYLVRLATDGRQPPSREEREEMRLLRYYLQKVGTNLNQLAHRLSRAALRGERPPPEGEIRGVVRQVGILLRELRRRL